MSSSGNPTTAGKRSTENRIRPGMLWFPTAVLIAGAALSVSLIFSGAGAPREVLDPGTFVRWALPVALTLHHLMLAAVTGCLVFAAVIVPPRMQGPDPLSREGHREQILLPHPVFTRTMTAASIASVVWSLSAVAVLVLTYSNLIGEPLSGGEEFTGQLAYFVTDITAGQAWLTVTVTAFVVSTLTFAVRSTAGIGLLAVLALTPIIPISLVGHAAGSDDHYAGVGALALHWLGVLLWVGGVCALAVVFPVLTHPEHRNTITGGVRMRGVQRAILERFSALAGAAFFLVLASGVINSVLRLGSQDGLSSRYGQLILIKTAATLILGVIGLIHRRWSISRLAKGTNSAVRTIWRLITVEVAIMAGVIGVAVALSRTAPPVPLEVKPALTPAEILTGYLLPPELVWFRWITEWRWDWLWIATAAIAAAAYLHGVRRTRAEPCKWPWPRTISWLAGLSLLIYVTSSAPAIYGMVLLSVHTTALLCLTLLIPCLLVLGAPLELAVKSVPRRGDSSRGVREWLDIGVKPNMRQIFNPILSGSVLTISLGMFYYTPVLRLTFEVWVAHQAANAYFLVVGFWFLTTVLGTGIHPMTPRSTRIGAVTGAAAALFIWAIVLAGSVLPLQAEWFGNLGRTWGSDVAVEQQLAGISVLLTGFLPLATIAAILMLHNPSKDLTQLVDPAAGEQDRQMKSKSTAIPG